MKDVKIETHYLKSPIYGDDRRVRVYLPNSYDDNKRFPVLYMHDGQNIFFHEESYSKHSWEVIEAITQLKLEIIVVGIDCSSEHRIYEYSPWKFVGRDNDIYGFEYAKWLVKTIKPFIDTKYKTLSDYKNSSLAGSSLGGLMTATIGATYPNVFSKLGVFSLASWVNEDDFLTYISKMPLRKDTKVYIQVGANEGDISDKKYTDLNLSQVYVDNSINYYQVLLRNGLDVDNTMLKIYHNEKHREKYWAKHFPEFLKFTQIKESE